MAIELDQQFYKKVPVSDKAEAGRRQKVVSVGRDGLPVKVNDTGDVFGGEQRTHDQQVLATLQSIEVKLDTLIELLS